MSKSRVRLPWVAICTLILTAILFVIIRTSAGLAISAAPDNPIAAAALTAARTAGSYEFVGDVTQTTIPTTKITNVGRTSRSEQLHIEGENNLRDARLELQLWADHGSVFQKDSGTAFRVENGKSYVRRPAGDWQEESNFSLDGIAPQGDFLAYLTAMQNITAHPTESRTAADRTVTFTRYSFELDSEAFAAYIRAQMETAMKARGEMPAALHYELPDYYRQMQGSGELWIGEDGLPLRQILMLRYPEQNDETVHAQITVDFAGFGNAAATTPTIATGVPAFLRGVLLNTLGLRPGDVGVLAIIPALLLGCALLIYFRRVRRLEQAMASAMIAALLSGPLLSTHHTVSFIDTQTAKAATQETAQQEAASARELRATLGGSAFNPHANPLAAVDAPLAVTKARSSLAEPLAPVPAPAAQLVDDGTDSDSDGLTDFAEARIGTDPTVADSDGDNLTDSREVQGIAFAGRTWYTDPLAPDSNNDGIDDGTEWGLDGSGQPLTTPRDTDSDGLPDLFDEDNDGDEVLDTVDASPFVGPTTLFTESSPFQLTLNNLTPNVSTFVDFQIRPTDPEHLWFALNVLDWPRDGLGQVQDVDDKTYADVAMAAGRPAEANDGNGDMKLIPMLEIRIPAGTTNLPPAADLRPYNITVNDFAADGSKVVYVPLNIVSDEESGERAAFAGRMRYLPTGGWPAAHQVRLAWVIQVLSDFPCEATDPIAVAQGCERDGYIHNVAYAVQSYYDEWRLTGLSAAEDHGASMALIYEDPAVDSNRKDDAALWALSTGLDEHFMTGNDQNNDDMRDVDLDEIVRRFDRTGNSGVSETQRWAVPNILRVQKTDYPILDQAVMFTAMTETVQLLNDRFTAPWTADMAIKPLILYAHEARSRALSLDGMLVGNGYVTLNGASLVLNMAPGGQPALEVDTMAGLKWTAYCSPGGAPPSWSACEMDTYWAELEQRYANAPVPTGETDPDLAAGRLLETQFYYTAFAAGSARTVQLGQRVISGIYSLPTDSVTEASVRYGLQIAGATVPLLADQLLTKKFGATHTVSKLFGRVSSFIKLRLQGRIDSKFMVRAIKINLGRLVAKPSSAFGVIGALALAVVQFASLIDPNALIANSVLLSIATALIIVFSVILPIIEVAQAVQAGTTVLKALTAVSEVSKAIKVAGIVGLVVAVLLTWAIFIYTVVAGGVEAFSPAFNRAFAEAFAATIYTIFLFVLASTVIGGIIVGIIAAIDFLLTIICELLGNVALFELPLSYQSELDNTLLSPALRTLFANNGKPLTNAATVVIDTAGESWRIIDGNKTYLIAKNSDDGILAVAEPNLLRQTPGLDGACFTLGTAAIKVLAYFLYNYDVMVSPGRAGTIVTGAPQVALTNQAAGYVAGNSVTLSLPVTTTIVHKDPDPANGIYINFYLYYFSPTNLRKTSFLYTLTPTKSPLVVPLNSMSGQWRDVREDHKYVLTPMYRGQTSTTVGPLPAQTLSAGLNQPIGPAYFNMAYAVPDYECIGIPNIFPFWFPPVIPVCYERSGALGTNSTELDKLYFDVFPPTLDEFMARSVKGTGRALAWDSAFGVIVDDDGDGLRSLPSGGNDPSDFSWDADNDGLADSFELQARQNGTAYNARLCDSDGDGLTDGQEADYASDPARADSDNDGLTDSEEIFHLVYETTTCQPTTAWEGGWDVGINSQTPFTVRVSSDPNNPDTDDDGIGDLAERVLAQQSNPALRIDDQNRPYHPRVFNTRAIVVYTADNAPDGVVGPGQSFVYTTTAVTRIPLNPSPLEIIRPAALGGGTLNATLAFDPLTFTGNQTATNQSTLLVQAGVASQVATITSRVRGQASGGGEIVSDGQHLITIDGNAPTSTIDSLQNGQYVQGGGGIFGDPPLTLIIGGSANDTRSDVALVEISVNGGAWQPVDGTASWSYALQVEEIPFTVNSGIYALRTRATDSVGNVEIPGAGITIYADATAPDHSYLPLTPARLQRKANGQWVVHLRFNARDFDIAAGARPGSDIVPGSVEARLRDSKGTFTLADDEIVAGWQPATLTLGDLGLGVWELDYLFPTTNVDPTGQYALDVRAVDNVGNRGRDDSGIAVLPLDAAAPLAALSTTDAMRSLITDTITLSGVITDEKSTVGVDTLDVAFVPYTQIAPLAEAVMRLDLNEAAGAVFFSDQTQSSNHAGCALQPGKSCPTAGGTGRVERAVTFSGASTEQSLLVANAATLNFAADASFAVQSWYKGTTANRTILQKVGAYALALNPAGNAQWQVTLGGSTVTVSGGPALTNNQWHHLVAVVDRAAGNTLLYVDGLLVGTQAAATQAATATSPLLIGGPEGTAQHLAGMVDEVAIFGRSLSGAEVQALYAGADRTWIPATLAARGSGIANTTWTVQVPAGLEAIYQIDFRTADMQGNRSIVANGWRGVIDTLAPRVVMTATATGAHYFDPALNTRRYAVTFVCGAQDEYLNEERFTCPNDFGGAELPPAVRSFDNDPILQSLFPDFAIRTGLVISYTRWVTEMQIDVAMEACDIYGNCATGDANLTILPPTLNVPVAVVVEPTDGSTVAAPTGSLPVIVAASSQQPLREVTLRLDGNVVDTANFAQADNVTQNQRTITVTPSGQGPHTLVAQATDWNGVTQTTLYPVDFVLDTEPPAVAITSDLITLNDTWQKGSGMLRFQGTAADSLCLASVKIKVGDGMFADATFADGAWQSAYWVNAPEGKTLSVTAQSTDCAGQVTEVTKSVGTDLSSPDAPDTTLTATPANPSTGPSATFSFVAVPGTNDLIGFGCQLDDSLYQPCASPWTLTNLTAGDHTFRVRAIDSEGFVDASPASFSWTVNIPGVTPTPTPTATPNGSVTPTPTATPMPVVAPVVAIVEHNGDIDLSWTSSSANSGYQVHRSTTPSFTPSAATLLTTLGAGATGYTDAGAAPTPSTGYFYIVRAVAGSSTADAAEVGALTYALNNVGDGYSLIGLPFSPVGITDAAGLATAIGDASAVLAWNPATQIMRFFAPPSSGDNFVLTPGMTIFVVVNSGGPSTVTLTGGVGPLSQTLTPGGFNFITVPLDQGALTSASALAADIGNVEALLAWNADTQLFRFFTPPSSGDDFAIQPGMPVVIQLPANGPTSWPVDGP